MTTYFADTMGEPPLLLRQVRDERGITDEAYLDGVWRPTRIVIDYLFGHNDFVDEIGEDEARRLELAAVS